MTRTPVGKGGLAAALTVFAVMAVTAFTYVPGSAPPPRTGICFPGPESAGLTPVLSWALNLLVLVACAFGLILLNRRHIFVQSTGMLLPAAFLVITASVPADVQTLSSGSLLAAANLLSLNLLFGCRENANNTYRLFAIASLLSLGSTFQAAFIPFAAAFMLAALAIKAMKSREAVAFLIGLISPYWAIFGLGIAGLSDITPQNPFYFPDEVSVEFFAIAGPVAVTAIWTLLTGFSNSLKLLKANSTVRAYNMVITLIGVTSMLGCLFCFSSLTAYIPTLAIAAATQLANAFALRQSESSPALPLILLLVYIAFFLLSAHLI